MTDVFKKELISLEQESKSNPNHIQADGVVNGGGRSPIHRNNNRHLNGIIRINITPNPLSDEKVRVFNFFLLNVLGLIFFLQKINFVIFNF